jgi:hypothetical protein
MHRPIDLKEAETTIVSAPYNCRYQIAFAAGYIQSIVFKLIGPHFPNDAYDLSTGKRLFWN